MTVAVIALRARVEAVVRTTVDLICCQSMLNFVSSEAHASDTTASVEDAVSVVAVFHSVFARKSMMAIKLKKERQKWDRKKNEKEKERSRASLLSGIKRKESPTCKKQQEIEQQPHIKPREHTK